MEGSKPAIATPDGPSLISPTPNTNTNTHLWPNVSSEDVRALASAASVLKPSPDQPNSTDAPYAGHRVTWFPEYGCALVGLGQPDSSAARPKARGAPSGSCEAGASGDDVEVMEVVEEGEEGEEEQEDGGALASCVRPCPGSLSLHLVALDGWGSVVHGSRKNTAENGWVDVPGCNGRSWGCRYGGTLLAVLKAMFCPSTARL